MMLLSPKNMFSHVMPVITDLEVMLMSDQLLVSANKFHLANQNIDKMSYRAS